uniref:Uncharacterized protein n=1 Tax=Anopheles merus TaxID=30066 RepID=A0A182VPA0_ANOME
MTCRLPRLPGAPNSRWPPPAALPNGVVVTREADRPFTALAGRAGRVPAAPTSSSSASSASSSSASSSSFGSRGGVGRGRERFFEADAEVNGSVSRMGGRAGTASLPDAGAPSSVVASPDDSSTVEDAGSVGSVSGVSAGGSDIGLLSGSLSSIWNRLSWAVARRYDTRRILRSSSSSSSEWLSVVGRIGPATGRKPPGGGGSCWGVVPAAPAGCSPSAPRWASGTDEVDVTDDATASGDSGANGGDVSGGMRCSISTSPSGPSPSSPSSRWCRPTIVWLRCSCFLRICSVSAADSGCCWRWAAAYVRTGGTGRLGGSPSDASDTAEDESPVPVPPPTPPPCAAAAAAAAGTGPCSQNAVRREPWPVRSVSNAASVACGVELASEWRESRVALDSTDSDRSRTGVRRDSESELIERGLSSAKVEQ